MVCSYYRLLLSDKKNNYWCTHQQWWITPCERSQAQKTAYSVVNSIHMKFEKWQSGMIAHRWVAARAWGGEWRRLMAKGHDPLGVFSGIMEISCIVMQWLHNCQNSLNYTLELGKCFVCSFGCAGSSLQLKGPLVEAHRFSCCSACVILLPWPEIKPVSLAL